MKRRRFLKNGYTLLSTGTVLPVLLSCSRKQTDDIPLPTPAQIRWQDCEIGIIYHFDLPIAAKRYAPNNTVREVIDPQLYYPDKLDTDQWLSAAKGAGAGYAIFTATHFNGFMQWQSDLYPYSLKHTKWRSGQGDVVADFVESCHKTGIKPGIYFSTHRNVYWQVWGHYVEWGKGRGSRKQAHFNSIAEKMTEELCSRYGPLIQIWYDAGVKTPEEGGPDVLPVFEKYQPDSVFYHNRQRSEHRWIGNELGYADYPCWSTMPGNEISHNSASWRPLLDRGDPEGSVWSPGMVDIPLRGCNDIHNWFWHPDQDHAVYSLDDLIKIYDQSVGRNCNLVIGEVITPEGLVPEHDFKRLSAFGNEIKRQFSNPVGEISDHNGNSAEVVFSKPSMVSAVEMQEDISFGERIRAYTLQGRTSMGKWQTIAEGESIGHKRIERFSIRELMAVRLQITKTRAEPKLKRMAVFNTI